MVKIAAIQDIECFLLDMDGTIYLSDRLINGALSFIKEAYRKSKKIIFLTNNSSKNTDDYLKKLKNLDVPVSREQIINSGEVTANYISQKKNDAVVYLLGTPSLHKEFEEFGLEIVKDVSDKVDFVVLGFDTSLTYKKLWDAHELILRGVPYLATNPDRVCPLSGGKTMPDCGSMINLLKTSTGREPLVIGKPNKVMVEYAARKTGVSLDKVAMVGDRVYTDMKMARNADITGVLVLSGETKKEDISNLKEEKQKGINYVFDNIGEIREFL